MQKQSLQYNYNYFLGFKKKLKSKINYMYKCVRVFHFIFKPSIQTKNTFLALERKL